MDRLVDWVYQQVVSRVADSRRRDRLRATQAAAVFLGQLAAWLLVAYFGYALLLWPFATRGVVSAFIDAGSSLFTLGFAGPPARRRRDRFPGRGDRAGDPSAADRLPADLVRGVQPPGDPGGPAQRAGRGAVVGAGTAFAHPLRARNGVSTLDSMPDLYARWESWAADVGESRTTYPVLVRFRSPGAVSSWVTALLAVLDSAAMFLALSPQAAPVVPARLCLRAGFRCPTGSPRP